MSGGGRAAALPQDKSRNHPRYIQIACVIFQVVVGVKIKSIFEFPGSEVAISAELPQARACEITASSLQSIKLPILQIRPGPRGFEHLRLQGSIPRSRDQGSRIFSFLGGGPWALSRALFMECPVFLTCPSSISILSARYCQATLPLFPLR